MKNSKNILVTGGAGYIGSHACKALSRAGYTPVAYDNLIFGHRAAVKWGPLVEADIADREKLDHALSAYRPLAVMHFAAFAYVGESVENPGKYYRNNVAGSLCLLEALRDHGIGRIIFSSTCATYGVPETVPLKEDHPQRPINPYGYSKTVIEQMLKDFDAAHGMRFICLRYFNAAGADPEGELGEDHDPETHLIPLVLGAAAGKKERLTIFGDDYDTPDGTCIRDYIHVEDLARAHVLGLKALESGAPSSIYNLGNGKGFSVKQVLDAALEITGRKIPVQLGPRRPGDSPCLVGDSQKIIRELGWRPRLNSLDKIIETSWRWHQHHPEGF